MSDSDFELDIEAMQLFEGIQGLDESEVNTYYTDEQRKMNDWRRCMVEFAYDLAFTLINYRLSESVIKNKEDMRSIIENLEVLAQIPAEGASKKVMVRHRGLTSGADSSKGGDNTGHDYVISSGDCIIDNQTLKYLIKNKIMDDKGLIKKLDRAFRFFSLFNIHILDVNLGEWELRDKQLVDASLLLWARYFTRVKSKSGIVYDESRT